jgi:hypothetical protein
VDCSIELEVDYFQQSSLPFSRLFSPLLLLLLLHVDDDAAAAADVTFDADAAAAVVDVADVVTVLNVETLDDAAEAALATDVDGFGTVVRLQ